MDVVKFIKDFVETSLVNDWIEVTEMYSAGELNNTNYKKASRLVYAEHQKLSDRIVSELKEIGRQ